MFNLDDNHKLHGCRSFPEYDDDEGAESKEDGEAAAEEEDTSDISWLVFICNRF